jgi:hypothetical protein
MTGNLTVVEIEQDYLDWATKLRQDRRPNAAPVTREEVGLRLKSMSRIARPMMDRAA